ncbi:Transporter, Major facilitator superfamily [Rubellimicrobium mesophilum DSM 19309]|uniref:Transporter, Major facilitator superfamily n=1 Tax=Rubellimicrobium mesophilum DSM 19309 TaxID=442562 RepID=A0A017HNR3_9RHOB|nr:MFS transporter [Rubellimicrobium mesophilum]EYD75808.1 Transporter, Major facilitator superfamily [Rubellimicrobium mesophilum DSM 19309]
MLQVLASAWALLLGMYLLMIGNGLQGTLLGLRGEIESFTTLEISVVMSAYFVGFLFASRLAPTLIRRVGHVRVFSALGSGISAILILYPILPEPWVWALARAAIGFCYCGVYITAESWLNAAASNENRGKALSLYMVVQMGGIITAQWLISLNDVSGFAIFIIPSILVSLSFAPALLSATQTTPEFTTTKPLKLKTLLAASPLACAGMFLLGSVFSAQFGMSAVYGTRAGLTEAEITWMVSLTYIAAMAAQYPIGWLSDRIDRRLLILGLSALGGGTALAAILLPPHLWFILMTAAVVGGTSNPLYALLIAYANDYLDREDMAGASAGLLFINGLGAIAGPLVVGWMMDVMGAQGFWTIIAVVMLALAAYAWWRMRVAPGKPIVGERTTFTPIPAAATPVAADVTERKVA